jgi:pyrroline-5-carboxylate reductase
MNISFIGYGKMAKAIIQGLHHLPNYQLRAASPSLNDNIDHWGVHTTSNNIAVINNADIIMLCVKPTIMANVIEEIKLIIPKGCLLISIAAGLNLDWFQSRLAPETAVIRAMPNIGAAVKLSATPLIMNNYVTSQQHHIVETLFNHIGTSCWVQQEKDMDIFTALSGSGPAYVFQFIQSMIDAAIDMGIEAPIAKKFALATVNGAVTLATQSDENLQQLCQQVTSKGGTTAAALKVLEDHHFSKTIAAAMNAARQRAQALNCTIL